MIVKQVPMRVIKKSSFAELVNYITNTQSKKERVGQAAVTNCQSDDPSVAILEVLNTQAQNTRAVSDKTYHLIISFRSGEQPSDLVLKDIEHQICDGLGYHDHQRVSVVHHDTDNLHIHVAINKIHPTRYTIHNVYNDHKTLASLGEKLERSFGLEKDNHQTKKSLSEGRAGDMERHAGVQSLIGWIHRECYTQIQAAQSWDELHQIMRVHSLELRERGNGLVVITKEGIGIKASSIGRDFSKSKLEKRFGIFQSDPENQLDQKSAKRYEKQPVLFKVDTTVLYASYKDDQIQVNQSRALESRRTLEEKNRLIEAVKRSARLKRSAIKLIQKSRVEKKWMYALASKTLKEKIKAIMAQYAKERRAISEKYKRLTWADWLRVKATSGDQEALKILRAREAAQQLSGNTLAGKQRPDFIRDLDHQDSVTKKGTVIYSAGTSVVRDDGLKLKVSDKATQADLQMALHMAMARYGKKINVGGTVAFKEQIVQAAVSSKLAIVFDDPVLEMRHQVLLRQATVKGREGTGVLELKGTSASLAADKYVAEREDKRLKGMDIKKHKRYNDLDEGVVIFSGTRKIDGQLLALLESKGEITVLPINEATGRQLKKIHLGSSVALGRGGKIKIKGRGR